MMCKLKLRWIREGIMMFKRKGGWKRGNMMWKLKGGWIKGGHYDVEMIWWMEKVAL